MATPPPPPPHLAAPPPRRRVVWVAAHPTGHLLAGASDDQALLWRVGGVAPEHSPSQIQIQGPELTELRAFVGHRQAVTCVAWAWVWAATAPVRGAHRLVSASRDGSIKLWDAGSGACTRTLRRTGEVNHAVLHVATQAHQSHGTSPRGPAIVAARQPAPLCLQHCIVLLGQTACCQVTIVFAAPPARPARLRPPQG